MDSLHDGFDGDLGRGCLGVATRACGEGGNRRRKETGDSQGFSVQFDGKDNPISGSMPQGADTISAKRTDSNHYVATLKKGGKVIGTAKVSVSKDGKVTTVDSTGTTASGAKGHDLQVYDKK
jgi:hypothetical protein